MMKKLNQMLATLMALLLLCGMAGCGETAAGPTGSTDSMQASGTADNPGNTDGPDNTKDPDHTDEPGKTEELGNTGELEGTILIGGDQNWVDASSPEGTFSDQGYYFEKNSVLHFFDTSSGVTTALCAKAGCLHSEAPNNREIENCDAYISRLNRLICSWKGSVYYLGSGAVLNRCDAVGIGRTEVCQLGEKYIKKQKTVDIGNYASLGGKWYYEGSVSGLVRDPDTGTGIFRQELAYIARVDLVTGKEEILMEDRENSLSLCAVSDNGVLFTAKELVDLNDPNSVEIFLKNATSLKYWDGKTGKTGALFRKASTFVNEILNGKAYCTTYTGKEWIKSEAYSYTFDLSTGEETRIGENISLDFWSSDYARRKDADTQDWYLYDLHTEKKLPIDLSEGSVSVQCRTDRGCILQWTVEIKDDTTASGINKEHRMCYAPYASLADGLQESDLMCYYTKKNGYQ